MKEKKILVLLPVTEEDKEYLVSRASGAAQPCRFVFSSLEEATEEDIASSQIIIGRFPVDKVKTAWSGCRCLWPVPTRTLFRVLCRITLF